MSEELLASVDGQNASTSIDDADTKGRQPTAFVHRLPVEVLGYIFRACFPSAGAPQEKPPTDLASVILTNAPCNISQVCSLWRAETLSVPALWSQWHVSIGDATPSTVRKLVGILSLWRDRSKDELLTAFVVVEGKVVLTNGERHLEGGVDAQCVILSLIDLLYELEARWYRIKISIYAPHPFIPSKHLDPSKYPNLEELHISGHPQFDCPSMIGGSLNIPQDVVVTTFSNLRTIVLGDSRTILRGSMITRKVMAILHHAPLLEKFHVTMSAPSSSFVPDNSPVVTLPHLQRLIFEVRKQPSENFVCKFVLDHLNAPALKTLYIKCRHKVPGNYDPSSSVFVSDFITRCCPPLKKLTLNMEIGETDLVGIVRRLPTLTVLYLDESCPSRSQFLSALLEKGDGEKNILCPDLHRFRFFAASDDVPLALDLLVSRWPSPFTEAVRNAALARWKECTQNIKSTALNEDMAVLDDGWEDKFEQWAAGNGCLMGFGKSITADVDAKPSTSIGLF